MMRAFDTRYARRFLVMAFAAAYLGVMMLLAYNTYAKPEAYAAPPRVGWICVGPNNIAIGNLRYVGNGRISCRRRNCRAVLRERPWCPRTDPRLVICSPAGFRRWCKDAIQVAWCESRFYRFAGGHGEYRGAFQMGSGERRRWGHGSGLRAQTRAARAYFDYARSYHPSGGWGPWQCRPRSSGVVV